MRVGLTQARAIGANYRNSQPGFRIADPGWQESPSTQVRINDSNNLGLPVAH